MSVQLKLILATWLYGFTHMETAMKTINICYNNCMPREDITITDRQIDVVKEFCFNIIEFSFRL